MQLGNVFCHFAIGHGKIGFVIGHCGSIPMVFDGVFQEAKKMFAHKGLLIINFGQNLNLSAKSSFARRYFKKNGLCPLKTGTKTQIYTPNALFRDEIFVHLVWKMFFGREKPGVDFKYLLYLCFAI